MSSNRYVRLTVTRPSEGFIYKRAITGLEDRNRGERPEVSNARHIFEGTRELIEPDGFEVKSRS
ncbi:hypothetical protein [Actinomyces urinae]|uniref:hypothetical protein n=1 Tax=Actinomyces urinae TaxID=1689268 RepID=UPI001178629D|nr:hypothetical protein [Actinomyces urinae]